MATLNNGSFESGSFSSWSTLGTSEIRQGSVTLGNTGDSNATFTPSDGSYFAQLTSQDQSINSIESFLGLNSGYINNSFDSEKDNTYTVGSAIKQSITISAGQKLSFDWKFKSTDYWSYNDSAFVISGPSSAKLASVYSAGNYGVKSGTYEYTFDTSGEYTIGVAIFNESDSGYDSYLGVDNFKITGGVTNHAPSTANRSVRINEDASYSFSSSDFSFSDVDSGDSLKSVLITSAPAAGQLFFDGSAISIGSSGYAIANADLSKLSFLPAANANGDGYASFQFKVLDQADSASASATLTLDVTPVNDAPSSQGSLNVLNQAYEAGSSQLGQSLAAINASGAAGSLFTEISDVDHDQLNVTAVRRLALNGSSDTKEWQQASTTDPVIVDGVYGKLALLDDGSYTYSVNEQHTDFLALSDGQQLVDHFEILVSDGTAEPIEQIVNISINGRDDVARPSISLVAGDDRVNRVEKNQGVTLSGLAPGASRVDVSWGSVTKHLAVINGTWSTIYATTIDPNQTNNLSAQVSEVPDDWNDTTIRIRAFDEVGHSSLQIERSVLVDTITPNMPRLDVVAEDDRINAIEKQNGVTLTGKTEQNANIIMTWDDTSKSTFSDGNGIWAITLNSSEIPANNKRSVIKITASDQSGNTSLTSRNWVEIDTVCPEQALVDRITEDNIINLKEYASGISLTGQIERGSAIQINWGALNLTPSASASAGKWSQWISAQQLSTLDLNAPIIAKVIDAAGNMTISAPLQPGFDLNAPAEPAVEPIGASINGKQVINAASKAAGVTLSGIVGSVETGSTILISWGPTEKSAKAAADGSWNILFSAHEIPRDIANSIISFQAKDSAGNASAIKTSIVTIDSRTPDAPKVRSITGDDLITASEAKAGIKIEGFAEGGATISLGWMSINRSTTTSTSGEWSFHLSESDLSLIKEDVSSINILATDQAGNNSSIINKSVHLARTAAKAPSFDVVNGDDQINFNDSKTGIVLSGKGDPNSQITLTAGTKLMTTSTNSLGFWSQLLRPIDLPESDGLLPLSAWSLNNSGLQSTVTTKTVFIDRTAPVLLNQVVSGNKLILTFSEDLFPASQLAGNFQLIENRSQIGISQAKVQANQPNVVELTMNRVPSSASTLSTTYTASMSGSSIADVYGNTITPFSNYNARNYQSFSSVTKLAPTYTKLELKGSDPITGIGNSESNTIIGNSAANLLDGGAGADVLTGLEGSDIFRLSRLTDSLLTQYDRVIDLEIGVDRIDGPNSVASSGIRHLGEVSALTSGVLQQFLIPGAFVANAAASFGFGNRTFVALNDYTGGYQPTRDAIIEITGYTGSLSQLEIV